ncbi:FlgN family protein [Candidatus Magnetomorum sp. HK-1]|nr:FlgN family protein [Candidatus Magnetomorum sp. HK-1]
MIEHELVTRFDRLKSTYEALYACLKEERRYLPQAKVEKLQVVVQKIEHTVSKINQERTDLLSVLSKFTGKASPSLHIDSLLRFISPMYHHHFQTTYEDVDRLTNEVKRYAKENRFLIEDSLNFIEETIHKVMGAKEKNTTYDKEMKLRRLKHNNLLLSKEV